MPRTFINFFVSLPSKHQKSRTKLTVTKTSLAYERKVRLKHLALFPKTLIWRVFRRQPEIDMHFSYGKNMILLQGRDRSMCPVTIFI